MVGAAETVVDNVLVNIVEAVGHHDVDPDVGDQDDQDAVDEGGGRDQSKGDKPEPQEDVDLLVDDVESEDAETVLVLDGARGTVLVEGTFGNLGEHNVHRIGSLLWIHVVEGDNIPAVGGEGVAKKSEN